MPEHPGRPADLIITCANTALTDDLYGELVDVEDLHGITRDGLTISVPWAGDPQFCIMLYTIAVEGGYADDDTAAAEMGRRLAGLAPLEWNDILARIDRIQAGQE
jgi:hypothetical protein